MKTLICDMIENCCKPVTHIDSKGFIYCLDHGLARKKYQSTRKLTVCEKNQLKQGNQISYKKIKEVRL